MNRLTIITMISLSTASGTAFAESWKRVDICDPLAHPDGSDIVWPVLVDNSKDIPKYSYTRGPFPFLDDDTNITVDELRHRRAAVRSRYSLWPSGVVPYVISPSDYQDYQLEVILDAMRHFERKTCIRFKKRTTEYSYIYIYSGRCCCSSVGRQLGRQYLSLSSGTCVNFETVVHELGHVVGFWHEQSRPDRDEHVTIHYENIRTDATKQFQKLSPNSLNEMSTPYDAVSVMHYRENSFSNGRGYTIESKHGIPLSNVELSPIDVLQIRKLYNCPKNPMNDPPKMVSPRVDNVPAKLPDNVGSCGYHLKGLNGTFDSPNYPNHYGVNNTCGWLISVPQGYRISLKFKRISLDSGCGDKIELFNRPEEFFLRESICGRELVNHIHKFNALIGYVKFTTDNVKGRGSGFTAQFTAEDNDECRSSFGRYLCAFSARCVNTIGSYKCMCPAGLYNPDHKKYRCIDVNECMTDNGGCSHKCINTYQSHKCRCPNGLVLSSNGKTCVTDACQRAGCAHHCTSSGSTFTCSCKTGYLLDANSRTCSDINECTSGAHHCGQNSICVNTPGSHRCECSRGYRLNRDKVTCQDIDECALGTHNCAHSCSNSLGSYTCSCRDGFELGQDGRTCKDIDECQDGHECQMDCINTNGGYHCGCSSGYQLNSDGKTCEDVDECALESDNCRHMCHNKVGSFTCSCRDGYKLRNNGRGCQDINECNGDHGCEAECLNSIGSYRCACLQGYELNEDQKTCRDIDECALGTHNCAHSCSNSLGSYTCSCRDGFELGQDGRTCKDVPTSASPTSPTEGEIVSSSQPGTNVAVSESCPENCTRPLVFTKKVCRAIKAQGYCEVNVQVPYFEHCYCICNNCPLKCCKQPRAG